MIVSSQSRLTNSGLLDQICRQIALGEAVNARMSARAASRCAATCGSPAAIRFVLSDRIRRRREVTEVGIAVALDEHAWWPARRGARRPNSGDGS